MAELTPPMMIDLNLDELIRLEAIQEHHTSGLIRKDREILSENPERPTNILKLVERRFKDLDPYLKFRLTNERRGDRYLIAGFAKGMSPDLLGRGGLGKTRNTIKEFTPDEASPSHKGATAYLYEGAVGMQIVGLLGNEKINPENIYAALIAHEVGHNLGLEHDFTPTSIMFDYGEASDQERKTWLLNASQEKLSFAGWQVVKMKLLITDEK